MAQIMKKYKLTTNLPLKIIAFVFAAFLWLIVANVANPVTKSTYTNIKVTIANDDVITQGGEVYTVLDDQNVNVVVYAKRSVIQQIKSDDIVATADIKEMDSRTGLIPISVSIPKYSGSYQSAEAAPRNIQIKTEPTGKTPHIHSLSPVFFPCLIKLGLTLSFSFPFVVRPLSHFTIRIVLCVSLRDSA